MHKVPTYFHFNSRAWVGRFLLSFLSQIVPEYNLWWQVASVCFYWPDILSFTQTTAPKHRRELCMHELCIHAKL